MRMGFVISPAKKMNIVEGPPHVAGLPHFVERTGELLEAVQALSLEQAQQLWQCSDRLARANYQRMREADLRHGLTAASIAYEGIQYQHLAPQVMDEQCLDYLDRHLRILSGFYGVLAPRDGVIPYRLEMQARLALPAQRGHDATANLYAYWDDALARHLATQFDTVINVASVEYAKAVTPYLAGLGVRVLTCLFGTVRPSDGKLLQRSTEAKAARGDFVRWCAEHAVEDISGLDGFGDRGYHLDPARSDDDTLVFVR